MAFDQLHPIDESWRADLRSAKARVDTYATHGVRSEVQDFMPRWGEEEKQQTPEQMKEFLRTWTEGMKRARD